jgi:type I restriction enzyme, S subunit
MPAPHQRTQPHMVYPTYPAYKPSGIDWLGNVPEHWEVKKLKYLGQSLIGITYSPEEIVSESAGTLVLRASNIQDGKLSLNDCVFVNKPILEKHRTQVGDILICARNGSKELVGKNIYITDDIAGQTFGAFMALVRSKYWKHLYWFFNSDIFKAQSGTFSTSTINQLTNYTLDNLLIAYPPDLDEQIQIANYLDDKLRQLDKIIDQKQELLKLLAKERAGIINEAVTKGLDAQVSMHDSGIPWLGNVPAHWEVKKLKYVVKDIIDTPHKTISFFEDADYYVVRTSDIKNGKLFIDRMRRTDQKNYTEWIERAKPEAGDIFLTREAPAGEACKVPEGYSICLGQRMVLLKTKMDVADPDFLIHQIYSLLGSEYISQLSQGSTVSHLNMSDIRNMPFVIPPIFEQNEIVTYLETETNRIDATVEKVNQEIALLTKYRSALISEVVTGKIKVV